MSNTTYDFLSMPERDYILGNKVMKIENSYDKTETYQSVVDRYFTKRFCLNVGDIKYNDYCILIHSNRICVVTLAPSHPLRAIEGKNIVKVDFHVSNKVNRLENKVSGRNKHGAQRLNIDSVLLFVDCSDGSGYSLYASIPGKLVEINDSIISNPNLLIKEPENKGYIAVVLSSIPTVEKLRSELLTLEDYNGIRFPKEDNKNNVVKEKKDNSE